MAAGGDDDRDAESRRILDRVAREAESGGSSLVSRAVRRARDHVSAADADRDDTIEYWGTRVGRVLGLVLTIGIIVWLVAFVTSGG
ncbi:MAG: hypothetical protein H0T56_13995 [Pseudaminobacter sp.]|nr:hypothetical protein [Pseudaminobacter sp.]